MIEAKILLDSLNENGDRLTTWVLTYPRFIHSEFNTHRMFSRNAASSRAVPIKKTMRLIRENPAMPEYWGSATEQMQAGVELIPEKIEYAKKLWLDARDSALNSAEKLNELGLHKQTVNRIMEPFNHITVLASSTDYENFFAQRAHPDAQPEIRILAEKMLELYNANAPNLIKTGDWHIPFTDGEDCNGLTLDEKLKISAARAARVSYLNFEGKIDHQKDYDLHDRLSKSGHWSAFEHAAQALPTSERIGNFIGWMQYRKQFQNENRADERVIKK